MLSRLSLALLLLATLPSCTSKGDPAAGANENALTDEQVNRYVEAYRALRKAGPKLAERYKAGEQIPIDAAKQDFAGIEDAIRQAGFSGGYPEFVRTNARVAWAFNTAQGRAFLEDFAGRVSEGEKEMQAAIDSREVPEEAKKELRAQLRAMKADYAKNKKWADVSMKVAGALTDQASVEVILRHRAELEAVFRGQ
ncbi:MAG TPA: hypothetical protein VGK67_14860 [Myxococcales bacterium]|jgi:hypothetical protein